MELKGRLKLIAQKLPESNIICDIGTDHAYIPIYAVSKNICKRAVASDVREGPLAIAKENIAEHGFKDKIEVRLGSGLNTVSGEELDTIVIAGMGGILIKDILTEDFEKACGAKTLILQPMNAIEVLREWLSGNGFEITDEELAAEGEKIYNVIVCKWTGITTRELLIHYYIGRKLIDKKDPLLKELLTRKTKQLEVILEEMRNTKEDKCDTIDRYYFLLKNYKEIMEGII